MKTDYPFWFGCIKMFSDEDGGLKVAGPIETRHDAISLSHTFSEAGYGVTNVFQAETGESAYVKAMLRGLYQNVHLMPLFSTNNTQNHGRNEEREERKRPILKIVK